MGTQLLIFDICVVLIWNLYNLEGAFVSRVLDFLYFNAYLSFL